MKHSIIYSILILLLFSSCDEGESILRNEDLIFTHSYPITIPEYQYADDQGHTWQVKGEESYLGNPDTLSAQPVFIWENIGIRIASIAVFRAPIEVKGGEITNVADIVWQWNSGMSTEKKDTVQFSEGGSVIIRSNGEIDFGPAPDTLESSRSYYWAVWGWGYSGTRVLYSSKELVFHVAN